MRKRLGSGRLAAVAGEGMATLWDYPNVTAQTSQTTAAQARAPARGHPLRAKQSFARKGKKPVILSEAKNL